MVGGTDIKVGVSGIIVNAGWSSIEVGVVVGSVRGVGAVAQEERNKKIMRNRNRTRFIEHFYREGAKHTKNN